MSYKKFIKDKEDYKHYGTHIFYGPVLGIEVDPSAITPEDIGAATAAQGVLAESALQSLQEGDNITIDNSNPNSPIISATGGGSSLAAGSGLRIDNGEIKLGSDSLSFLEGRITEDTIIGDLDVDGIGKGIMFDSRSSLLSILNRYEEEDFQAVSRIDISDSSVNILSGDYDPSLGEYTRVGGINVNREHASLGLNSDQGLIGLQLETGGDQVFIDSINNKGLVYESDYSANFTDRSLVDKGYVDAQSSPLEIMPVTQTLHTDKAINVKSFNNTGMTYSEGSIDFGITRDSTHAMGVYAFKQGIETTASGDASSAFGQLTTASGYGSSTFGTGSTASAPASSAFGTGTTANEFASLAIGRYSTDGTAQTTWVNGSPIFKVGNGTGSENRSNAYVLYNDGRSEQVKDMEVTEIGQGFVLKSPDGSRWRITVDDSGDLTTTAL